MMASHILVQVISKKLISVIVGLFLYAHYDFNMSFLFMVQLRTYIHIRGGLLFETAKKSQPRNWFGE